MTGLNRDEWNVAYFLGLEEIACSDLQCDFNGQIEAGESRLAAVGYRFCGGWLEAEARPRVPTAHEGGCRELAEGTFDGVGRAREALQWLGRHAPGMDCGWLRRVVADYDRVHVSPAPFRPSPRHGPTRPRECRRPLS